MVVSKKDSEWSMRHLDFSDFSMNTLIFLLFEQLEKCGETLVNLKFIVFKGYIVFFYFRLVIPQVCFSVLVIREGV